MTDLFPDSLRPEAIGFDAIRHAVPVFFAIYPSAGDLPRVVAWQRRVCQSLPPPGIVLRPPGRLHISVAACGAVGQQRQPFAETLRLAAERFVYPSFDLTVEATARFARDRRAYVAVADQAGTRAVHGLRIALADAQKPFGLAASDEPGPPHARLWRSPVSRTAASRADLFSRGRGRPRRHPRWPFASRAFRLLAAEVIS